MKLFKVCPKTHRIVGVRSPREAPRYLFPIAGFLALVWFLVRVLPKPSRATYPCQRLAAPLAGSFLMWSAGIIGGSLLFRKARLFLRNARYLAAALALVGALVGLSWSALSLHQPVRAAYTPHPANSPIGTAKGLLPGRVAWAHDPLVTDWNGTASSASQSWFNHISQTEATNLMQWAIMGYAGTNTTSAAWDAIFHYFNGGSAGYQPGEKISIKVNMTTTQADACADVNYNWMPSYCGASWTTIGPSPQLMVALLDQLVNTVGAAQSDITIGDSNGLWVNELYNPVHTVFPNVKYLDGRGTLGRTHATRSSTRLYWSTTEDDTKSPDYLLQAVVDAKYIINFALLKTHERNGITLTAKNHFGSLSGGNGDVRKPATTGFYDLHLRLPLETAAGAWPQRALMAQYRPLVDLNGDTGMGGKTVLYLIDSIFAGEGADPKSTKWAMAPFNNNWPSSLFVSMDEVAIDSVGLDFLSQQFPKYTLAAEGVQDYLHEMALADNPPSGTFYDPEGDGIRMTSQGVHEHWNNATDKQYSRNLDTGNGIELVYLNSAPPPTFTVTFEANGGSGAMSPQTASSPTVLTLNTFTRSGYTFASWNTASDGSGTPYGDGATYPFSASATLYAQWTAVIIPHTVNFDANGGTGTMAPQSASTPTTLMLNAFTNAGYSFSVWNTARGGGGTAYADGTVYSFAVDVTLYAQWIAQPEKTLNVITNGSTGTGIVTSNPSGINCGSGCMETFPYGTLVTLTATPSDNYNRFIGWSGTGIDCPGTGTCTVLMTEAKTVTAMFEKAIFNDVPYDYFASLGGIVYPLHDTIQALYDSGYTAGCSTDPLSYCPDNTLTRVEAAVFMLRGMIGTSYTPPTDPAGYVFTDDWSSPTVSWGQSWAEGMWDEGLTAGCSTDPLLFCPATTFTRAEAGVFGLRIENGAGYTPPAATHIFADDWSDPMISWAEAWAEQAYLHGILPACGESGGKPLFCPVDLVTRAWAAYLVVEAKNLLLTP